MSDRHPGLDNALRRLEAVHAKDVHGKAATYTLDAREKIAHEKVAITGIEETTAVRKARAEKIVAQRAEGHVPISFLLEQLEEAQRNLQDATEDENADGISVAEAEIKLITTRIQKQREAAQHAEETKSKDARDAHLIVESAQLPGIEEYDDLGIAFRDTVEQYVDLHKKVNGDATLATQRISRSLRNRMTELLPAAAKHEITRNLKHLSKEQYTEALKRRVEEINKLEDGEGLEDTDRRLIERDLIRETLRQLDRWDVVDDVAPSLAEYKKRQRVAKANVTRLENQKKKITQQLDVSWWRPMEAVSKLLPWRRWALHRELDKINLQAARERGRLKAFTSFTEASRPQTEVRMNVPYFEEDGERATQELYDNDYEIVEKPQRKNAA